MKVEVRNDETWKWELCGTFEVTQPISPHVVTCTSAHRASTKIKISNLKQGAKLYLNEVHMFGTPIHEGKTFLMCLSFSVILSFADPCMFFVDQMLFLYFHYSVMYFNVV